MSEQIHAMVNTLEDLKKQVKPTGDIHTVQFLGLAMDALKNALRSMELWEAHKDQPVYATMFDFAEVV